MNRSRFRHRLLLATGLVLVGGPISVAAAQSQYPITPPSLELVVPSTTTVPGGSAVTTVPGVVPAAPASVASNTVATPVSGVPATTLRTDPSVAPALAPVAGVLGERLTANPAFTGSNATKPLATAGLAFVVAGTAFVVTSRRRRRQPA